MKMRYDSNHYMIFRKRLNYGDNKTMETGLGGLWGTDEQAEHEILLEQ